MNALQAPTTDSHAGTVYAMTAQELAAILAEMRRDGMMYHFSPLVQRRLDAGFRISFAPRENVEQFTIVA